MDIRKPVVAVLVGGSPAPGVNAVICSVTIEAINSGCDVIGIYEGYKRLREGKSKTIQFAKKDVQKLFSQGGSVLRTSKMQLTNAQEVDNVLRVLELLRVRYLITIGGVNTAHSTTLVAAAAKSSKYKLSVIHVPKTIFNDIPLPSQTRAFGFNTARQVGHSLVQMFQNDASTMVRWYVLTCVGVQSGHLTLGIGKSAAAHLTIIPEEYKDSGKPVTFGGIVDLIEASIYKRRMDDNNWGIVMLCEGLVDLMEKKEIEDRFGSRDDGHQDLGRHVCKELQSRFKKTGLDITTVPRLIGTECRAADPSAADILMARDLGYGAVRSLMTGVSGALVMVKGGAIQTLQLTDLLDPKTGASAVRCVSTKSVMFQVAQSYMTKLKKTELKDAATLQKIAAAANIKPQEFVEKFEKIAI
jgi:6-phosphofructokinase 1